MSAMVEVLGRINVGFKVFMAYAFNDDTGVVIAKKERSSDDNTSEYVVWNFNFFTGDVSFYWGYYTNKEELATKNMMDRVMRLKEGEGNENS